MALTKQKTDPELGERVKKVLLSRGVETPMADCSLTSEDTKFIQGKFKEIMEQGLHLDLSDDSLCETPKRVAKMFIQEIFWGLDYNNFPKVTTIDNKMQYSNMLIERNITVNSFCEHHFLPFIGVCHIAYIPASKVIGLSKLNRVVEFFSRRPQVQERLVEQIYLALEEILETENVAVIIQASHTCVRVRGVEDTSSDTITAKLGGLFFENAARNEFYQLIKI